MNRYAKAFGMENTNFSNCHGLGDFNNKSTAADIGRLSCICMMDPMIRETAIMEHKFTKKNFKGVEKNCVLESGNFLS